MSSVVRSSGLASGPQSTEEGERRGDQPVADLPTGASPGDKGGWKFLRDKKAVVTSLDKDSALTPPSIPSLAVQVKRLAVLEVKIAARLRRKSFAHHDCVSVLSNLSDSSGVSKKSFTVNVKSGASAISDTDGEGGDGKSNSLVLSTPQFRNEVGDELRKIGIGELEAVGSGGRLVFAPASCVGVLMEEYDMSKMDDDERRRYRYCRMDMWRPQGGHQNKDKHFSRFNHVDIGVLYYRRFFSEYSHQNFFGIDEGLGPVAVSIRREIIQQSRSQDEVTSLSSLTLSGGGAASGGAGQRNLFRVIVRTSHPNVLRGSVSEDSILAAYGKPKSSSPVMAKDIISFVAPEVQLGCLRFGQASQRVTEQLMKLDESSLSHQFKFGVMYCKADQMSEEEMYNNDEGSEAFDEFMACIADKVELKGFQKYRAQLDNRTDSTGSHSYYTYYEGNEIMFHVSTLLPSTPSNRQQLLRKRHIGNDIVTIIFQEKGALPFTPATIRSHFQHIFAVVRCLDPCSISGKPRYQVAVSQAQDIPMFGPALNENGIYTLGADLREFLLTKLINSECASHACTKFLNMAQRTRYEYLNDLAENYSTQQAVDTNDTGGLYGKLARMRKREKSASSGTPTNQVISSADLGELPGALMWSIQVTDWGIGEELDYVECLLCISLKSVCLVDEELQAIRMCIPTEMIIGWSINNLRICLYYGQGAYVALNLCNVEEQGEGCISEIRERLAAAAPNGCESTHVHLERSPGGNLGFMIHRGGIVGQVDTNGVAYSAGIRQGSRIVEMDGIPIYGRLHYYVVGHLKKAKSIDAILIAPHSDGAPRGGKTSAALADRNSKQQKSTILRKGRLPQRSASSRAPGRRLDAEKRKPRASNVGIPTKEVGEIRSVAERAKLALNNPTPVPQVRTDGRYCESDV